MPFQPSEMLIRASLLALIAFGAANASTFDCEGSGIFTLSFQSLDANTIVNCGGVQYTGFSFSDSGFGIPNSNAVAIFTSTNIPSVIPAAMVGFFLDATPQALGGATLDAMQIPAGSTITMTLDYEISSLTGAFYAGSVWSPNWSDMGSGSVTITSNKCFGGPWTLGDCMGIDSISPSIVQTSATTTSLEDTQGSLGSLNVWVMDTVTLSAGRSDFSAYVGFEDSNTNGDSSFSPEPSAYMLVLMGLCFVICRRAATRSISC